MDQKNLKILIVDDEKQMAEVLGKLIEVDGHDVTVTYDGQEGLEIFKKEKFDVILADISMPGMNGIDLTQRLLEIDENAKVIAITGHLGTQEVDSALSAGAKKFLRKPFTRKDIEQTIQEVLRIS